MVITGIITTSFNYPDAADKHDCRNRLLTPSSLE